MWIISDWEIPLAVHMSVHKIGKTANLNMYETFEWSTDVEVIKKVMSHILKYM